MPQGAIDAHMHVIGPFDRFPLSAKAQYKPFAATWQEQQEILCKKLGFWGYVVVQATAHGTDNRVVVDALEHMDGRAAGVAASAFERLSHAVQDSVPPPVAQDPGPAMGSGGRNLEDIVKEMLRPMLKDWLDKNLPPLVERYVEREIVRLTRR